MVIREEREDLVWTIDEENKIVVCSLHHCEDIATSRIFKRFHNLDIYFDKRYRMKSSYVGVAKCNPQDDFNVEFGKDLSLYRAKVKRNKAANRAIQKYIRNTARTLKQLADYDIHEMTEEDRW